MAVLSLVSAYAFCILTACFLSPLLFGLFYDRLFSSSIVNSSLLISTSSHEILSFDIICLLKITVFLAPYSGKSVWFTSQKDFVCGQISISTCFAPNWGHCFSDINFIILFISRQKSSGYWYGCTWCQTPVKSKCKISLPTCYCQLQRKEVSKMFPSCNTVYFLIHLRFSTLTVNKCKVSRQCGHQVFYIPCIFLLERILESCLTVSTNGRMSLNKMVFW